MEIEETFHLIGVGIAIPILVEEADRSIERVDHDPGRLASLGGIERWIEATNEIVRVIHAIGAEHEIETRWVALQLQQILEQERITKTQLATRMKTSRASLDRILDPANPSLTVASLGKEAAALGRKVELRFVPA
ncbi:MAG: XRE family transcriptional regulator [Akkermansiaceae bacterium]|nr:XRE family transcriptional regulator [Akkermansiaceae bacterium]